MSIQPPAVKSWTSENRPSDRRQAAAAGFDRHLVKPVDLAKLEAALDAGRRAT